MRMRNTGAIVTIAMTASLLIGLGMRPDSGATVVEAGTGVSDDYTIDGVHSSMVFRVKHLGVSYFYGRFNDISGEFTLEPDDLTDGKITVKIDMSSVDTNSNRRDNHLRSADFFDVKAFPSAEFESEEIRDLGDGRFEIKGDLSLHGVTKPLTATAEWIGEGEAGRAYRAGFTVDFTISRSEFGIDYMPDGLGDDVKVMFGIEGIRK